MRDPNSDVLSVTEFIRFQMPVLSHEKVRDTVIRIINGEVIEDMDQDELAYVLSLYTQANKILGKAEIAAEGFEKTRKIMQARFEGAINSYPLAAAYMAMLFYTNAEGNHDMSTFYTNVVTMFLNKHNTDGRYNCIKNLQDIFVAVSSNNFDIGYVMKKCMTQLLSLRVLCQPNETLGLAPFSQEEDIEELLQSRGPMGEESIEKFANVSLSLCDKMSGILDPSTTQIRRYFIMFLANGAVLQIHHQQNKLDDVTRRTADFVATLTTTSYFNMAPPIAAVALVFASNVHLQFLELSTSEEDRATLIARLKEDLYGMECVTSWFKIFKTRFQFMMDRVRQVLDAPETIAAISKSMPEFGYDFANTLQNFAVALKDKPGPVPHEKEVDNLDDFDFEVGDDPFVDRIISNEDFDSFFEDFV